MRTLLLSSALALALAAGATPLVAQDMIGITWSGDVYALDSVSGVGVLLGDCGFNSINAMAKDPASGRIFASSGGTILEIHPATGLGSVVVITPLTSIRAMAFLGNDLYAIEPGTHSELHRVDLGSGAATRIGDTGISGVQCMTAANGVLYGWALGPGTCMGDGLITLDPQSGVGTDVNPAIGSLNCDVQTLCTAPGGAVYALRDEVHAVNLATGALTTIGGGGYVDLRGAEFLVGAPTFALTRSGTCPGIVTLASAHGTPNGVVAVLRGGAGSFTKPGGACAGLTLPLASPAQATVISSDAGGNATVSLRARAGLCGITVVFVDTVVCAASNAVVL